MLIASADIIFLVSSVKGVCREIISELRKRKSNSTFSTPNSFDFSGVRNGSKANTFIFKPKALFETIEPILPQPIKPKVFPVISVPLNFDFSHFPFLVSFVKLLLKRLQDVICVLGLLFLGAFVVPAVRSLGLAVFENERG